MSRSQNISNIPKFPNIPSCLKANTWFGEWTCNVESKISKAPKDIIQFFNYLNIFQSSIINWFTELPGFLSSLRMPGAAVSSSAHKTKSSGYSNHTQIAFQTKTSFLHKLLGTAADCCFHYFHFSFFALHSSLLILLAGQWLSTRVQG